MNVNAMKLVNTDAGAASMLLRDAAATAGSTERERERVARAAVHAPVHMPVHMPAHSPLHSPVPLSMPLPMSLAAPPLHPVALGHTGITTSALALGCARLGSVLTPLNRSECVALIREAYALGVRHFDTASIYGHGDSERFLGEALAAHRDQVCLSSKAGQRLGTAQALLTPFKAPLRWLAAQRSGLRRSVAAQRARPLPRCFEPDFIEQSLRASLRRLRTDHLDVFYLHSPPAGTLGNPRLMARIERLRAQGLFRSFGVSCDSAELVWEAAAHEAVSVVQFAHDGSTRTQAQLAELARCGKAAVLRGVMTHTPHGVMTHTPHGVVTNTPHTSSRSIDEVEAFAPSPALREREQDELRVPVSSNALWHHSAGPDTPDGMGVSTPHPSSALLGRHVSDALQRPAFGGLIVGTTSIRHLRENVAAFGRAATLAGVSGVSSR